MKLYALLLLSVCALSGAFAASAPAPLKTLYKRERVSKAALQSLKEATLKEANKAVPTLIEVMKSGEYPERNRWVATFMLGRIMGKKSAPFIAKFSTHPNWLLRLASLKTLLALDQKQYKGIYARALKDDAMVVRMQALENIKLMNLQELAPHVWAMLYDKSNYSGSKGARKRSHIVKQAILAVGDLRFEKAQKPLLDMAQKKKYKDVFKEVDYSLEKITGKDSPDGDATVKRRYWSRLAVAEKTF